MSAPSFLVNPLSLYEHIKTKQKIMFLDSHHYLPWILLSDKDNNVIIYDVSKKHVIRAFSVNQYLPDDITIKDIKFFDCIDEDYIKKYIDEYENQSMAKHKGIPLNLRSSLIYLVSDKYVFFYSYLLQNFIRYIPHKEFNNYNIVEAQLYDYSIFLILTEEGNIYKWNLHEWTCSKEPLVTKQEVGKGVSCMKVIQLLTGEKYVIISNKNGKLFKVNLNLKSNNLQKIDTNSKAQHEKEVTFIDFNPHTGILVTLCKTSIILYEINNINNFRKISNFTLVGKENIIGMVPNLSTCFNKYSYFIYGKKGSKLYLLDLRLHDQNKFDTKNFIKHCPFMIDLDKTIFRKVNDEEIRIFNVTILQHLYEYFVIGSNKGLIIFKFDSSNKVPICTLSMTPKIDKNKVQNFFFYNLTKENLLLEQKLMISFDKKNKMLLKSDSKKIEDNILDNNKVSVNRYEIRLSFDCTLMSCLDTVANVYTIFKIVPDNRNNNKNCISEIKKVEGGEALCLEWSPYSNNFAITKQVSSNKFILQVYAFEMNAIKKVYEVKDLFTHKIYGGHFIGVIVTKNGEHLQVQMKYANSYNYELSKETELNFYYWDEENKLILTLKEEPISILSSEDLQFMIICFEDKYNIYQLNDLTGSLEKINTVYDKVVSGIIYENIVFVYLTEYGTYFQLLNKENCFPCKLFRQSDEVNIYNLKISKKFKENKSYYEKKPKQIKILCINDNLMFTSDAYGNIEVSELNHILFKVIALIKKKNLAGISALLSFLDKKLIKYVLIVFDYYFENDEEILRKIFNNEMIHVFELYNYFEFFLKDLAESYPGKLENILEKNLIKAIIDNDKKKINEIYEMAKKYDLKMATKAARTINKNIYLDSLMNKKRYVDSYLFNITSKVNNQNNENILSMAIGQITGK
jgi:WD40 repeat protein